MEILELIIRAIIQALSPPPPPKRRGPVDEMELIRRRMALAQQQDRDILTARMPPPVRQAQRPAQGSAQRQAQRPQTRPQRAAIRSAPAAPTRPAAPTAPPAPPAPPAEVRREKPARIRNRYLSPTSLRSAIIASEILQPPLSLRD